MYANMAFSSISFLFFLLVTVAPATVLSYANYSCEAVRANDRDLMHFAMNLEFVEAEFFLHGAMGKGLDDFHPQYAEGGPPPIGAQKANLDPLTYQIIREFGLQELGHIRAIRKTVGGIPRPLIDLRAETIGRMIEQAVGRKLHPPFNPYDNSLNYIIACYLLPYVGVNGYTGTNPYLTKFKTKYLLAGLLGVEAEQDAVIRAILYAIKDKIVEPYGITVTEFTVGISNLRNELGRCGIKDEGLWVPPQLGAENMTESNIISADYDSLSYPRSQREILRVVYGTGSEYEPGGFLPKGGNGRIARSFLDYRD